MIPDYPIFNVADSSIFVGVALILLNQTRFFGHANAAKPLAADDAPAAQSRHEAETTEVV